jgi:hypothetical protein
LRFILLLEKKSNAESALAPTPEQYYIASDNRGNINFSKTPPPILSPSVQYSNPYTLGKIYQNLSILPLYVSVCDSGASAIHSLTAFVDNVTPPFTLTSSNIGGPLLTGGSVFFIVLPNYFYKVVSTDTNSIVNSWIEWS